MINIGEINNEFGFKYSDYSVDYIELSIERESFSSLTTSQLFDVFHQTDISAVPDFVFNIGNRIHYFSNGSYLRWSPRLKVNYNSKDNYSLSLGYSRNYQFMHRLEFYNINSNDFWILSNEDDLLLQSTISLLDSITMLTTACTFRLKGITSSSEISDYMNLLQALFLLLLATGKYLFYTIIIPEPKELNF